MTALRLAPGTLRDKRSAKTRLGEANATASLLRRCATSLAVVNSGRSVDEILDEILSHAARLLASDVDLADYGESSTTACSPVT